MELPWVQPLSSADLSVQESRLRYRPSALVSFAASVAVSAPVYAQASVAVLALASVAV